MQELFLNELMDNPGLYADGLKILFQDILLRTVPIVLAMIIAGSSLSEIKGKARRAGAFVVAFILNIATGIGAYLLSHYILLNNLDIDHTLGMICKVWFSYQDYGYVGASLFICLILAASSGLLTKLIVSLFAKGDERIAYRLKRVTMKTRIALSVISCFLLVMTITLLFKGFSGVNHIIINEVCTNNSSVQINELYDVADYVELYNIGNHPSEMGDLYISDDEEDLKKIKVDDFIMAQGCYAVISLKDADFGLSKTGGDTVYLSDSVGNVIDSVYLPGSDSDVSYSRAVNGADVWVMTGCTPGYDNSFSVDKIDAPEFSVAAGFYGSEFDLELSASPEASIFYTLDGSKPSMDSIRYEGPIHIYNRSGEENAYRSLRNVVDDWAFGGYEPDTTPVDKAMVVRAIAIADDRHMSEIVTGTYFVGLEGYEDHAVISLAGNPSEIFGDNGIYVTGTEYDEWVANYCEGDYVYPNYSRRGRAYEVPVSMEYFSKKFSFEKPVGMRIQGNSSASCALKNLSLFAQKNYDGDRYFPKKLLGTSMTHSLTVRGGYANAVYQDIVKDRDVITAQYTTADIFINGEYFYSAALTEKYSDDYFAEHYGIDRNNLMYFKDKVITYGNEGEEMAVDDFETFAYSLDFTKDEDYEKFCRVCDVQSYIDLMAIYLYIDNEDYIDFEQNAILWKTREKTDDGFSDGRWRWALYDLDGADIYDVENRAGNNPTRWLLSQKLFSRLILNETFKKQFLDSFMDIAENTFSMKNVEKAMDKFPYETENFKSQLGNNGTDGSVMQHRQFFEERKDYIIPYVEEAFNVSLR